MEQKLLMLWVLSILSQTNFAWEPNRSIYLVTSRYIHVHEQSTIYSMFMVYK